MEGTITMSSARYGMAKRHGWLAAAILAACGPQARPHPSAVAAGARCDGAFSDGTRISVTSPAYLNDVPGDQLFCDFHTFAWNQFLYLTQMQPDPNNGNQVTPLFLHQAPWYNALKADGSPQPGGFPGGGTALQVSQLDQGQAGDDDQLLDVNNATVLYDIRFNSEMYNAIVGGNLYTEALYSAACKPDGSGNCANPLYLPPTTVTTPAAAGSVEIKSAWRDFGTPGACPAQQFYCNGRLGLVGLHIVQKTQSHGEWIWMSFEHAANDPDCYPYGDAPVSPVSPLGTPWSFFNPATAGSAVMASQICEVTGKTPQCNADPGQSAGSGNVTYQAVNICRTDYLPPGGASSANCTLVPDGPPQQSSNSAGNVACLNATLMPQRTGVWQNYKMIGSLWLRGTTPPTQGFRIQIFQPQVTSLPYEQPVGFPNLANTMMETWLQSGSTGYDPFGTNATQAGCFLCHNPPSALGQFPQDDLSHYPGKLPPAKLRAALGQLVPASSTTRFAPAPHPRRPRPVLPLGPGRRPAGR
jgi:hypothetical protein